MPRSPWPVTDDRLLLNQALKDVLSSCRGMDGQGWLRASAIDLILNAYEQGVRDRETLVQNALMILKRDRRRNASQRNI
jgi:hypothetical protein